MAGLASMAAPAVASEYRGYQTPVWTVERGGGEYELRRYQPYLAAEVTIKGNPDTALRQGFQTLAGFIFGGNEGASKVAMTSPVVREPARIAMTSPVTREAAGDAWTVRFMMPREYTADTLPRPDNGNIRIVTVSPGLRAAHRFSGLANGGDISKAEARLRAWMTREGLEATGPSDAAWFDDPFTLPWRRRNEVSIPVRVA